MTKQLEQQIKAIQSAVNNVTKGDVKAPNRKRRNVDARSIYFRLCRELLQMSTTEIGRTVSKDHATVLYGLKQFKALYDTDREYARMYNSIIKLLHTLDFQVNLIDEHDVMLDYVDLKQEHMKLKEEYAKMNSNIDAEVNRRIELQFSKIDYLLLKKIANDYNCPWSLRRTIDCVLDRTRN